MTRILRGFLLGSLLAAASSTASPDATILSPAPASVQGTYELNVCVPNTRDSIPCVATPVTSGGWASRVDVYYPTQVTANNAQTIVPGATGTGPQIAYQLHYTTVNGPVTSAAQVNFPLMNKYFQAVVAVDTVAPVGQAIDYCNYALMSAAGVNSSGQLVVATWSPLHQQILKGQAISLGSSPYTATSLGVTVTGQVSGTTGKAGTYSLSSNPGAKSSQAMVGTVAAPNAPVTTTSCDRVETNGQDDPEFYIELSDWESGGCIDQYGNPQCGATPHLIGTVGGSAAKSLEGFSNGGELVYRMWCEVNKHFARYVSFSGMQAYQWYGPSGVQACSPASPVPPFLMINGALDLDTGICTACTSASNNNWTNASWIGQNSTPATIDPPAEYVPSPYAVCSAANSYTPASCTGPQIPEQGDPGFSAVATVTSVGAGTLTTWCYGGATCPIQLDYFSLGAHSPASIYQATGNIPQSTYVLPWEKAN